jgi:hypothetical protein
MSIRDRHHSQPTLTRECLVLVRNTCDAKHCSPELVCIAFPYVGHGAGRSRWVSDGARFDPAANQTRRAFCLRVDKSTRRPLSSTSSRCLLC